MADILPPRDTFTPEQAAAEIIAHAHFHGLAQTPGFNFGHFVQHVVNETIKVAADNAPDIADVAVDLAGEVIGGIVG